MSRYRPWKKPKLENKPLELTPEERKKMYPGQRINRTAIYKCEKCGETFRLKYNLLNHQCRRNR